MTKLIQDPNTKNIGFLIFKDSDPGYRFVVPYVFQAYKDVISLEYFNRLGKIERILSHDHLCHPESLSGRQEVSIISESFAKNETPHSESDYDVFMQKVVDFRSKFETKVLSLLDQEPPAPIVRNVEGDSKVVGISGSDELRAEIVKFIKSKRNDRRAEQAVRVARKLKWILDGKRSSKHSGGHGVGSKADTVKKSLRR